jgi:hypothetical protein
MHSQRFRMAAALVAGFLFSLSMVSLSSAAPLDAVPSYEVVKNRLNLTPAQEATLQPMFVERVSQLGTLRTQLEQAGSKQERRSIMRDARKQADDFNKRVESQLDVTQKQAWREVRAQTREKLRERVEEKRDSGS